MLYRAYARAFDTCQLTRETLPLCSAMMYASYFALFAQFLVNRYFFSKPKAAKGKKAPGAKAEALKKEE